MIYQPMKKYFILLLLFMVSAGGFTAPELPAMGSNKGGTQKKTEAVKASSPVTETIQVTIPPGTAIKAQLNQSIRTSTHRANQSFFATLKEPLLIGTQVVVPAGVPLIGVISRSVESGHFSGTALLELKLVRIILTNETVNPITTEPFQKEGRAHLLRNIGLIGVGAIVGAGVGTLLGQTPGALTGIALGGGTGAVLAYVTGKEDLFLKAGIELIFKLSGPMTVTIPSSPAMPLK